MITRLRTLMGRKLGFALPSTIYNEANYRFSAVKACKNSATLAR